jgi:hypothetical protein
MKLIIFTPKPFVLMYKLKICNPSLNLHYTQTKMEKVSCYYIILLRIPLSIGRYPHSNQMIIKKLIFVHKRWHLLVKITNRIASDMRIKYYCVHIEKWVSHSNVKWQITDIIKQCSCGVILISLRNYSLFKLLDEYMF